MNFLYSYQALKGSFWGKLSYFCFKIKWIYSLQENHVCSEMTYQNIKLSETEYQPAIEIKFSDDDKIVLRELHSRLFLKASSLITSQFIFFVKLGHKIDFFCQAGNNFIIKKQNQPNRRIITFVECYCRASYAISKNNGSFSSCNEIKKKYIPFAEIEKLLIFLKLWNILVEKILNNLLSSSVHIWNPRH